MTSPALTMKVFAVYLVATGIGLLLAPGLLLAMFGLPPPTEVWVHVLGLVAAVLGYYYWASAAADDRAFFAASVYGRGLFAAGCIGLVLWSDAPWQIVVFGVTDLAGAAWTKAALSRQARY